MEYILLALVGGLIMGFVVGVRIGGFGICYNEINEVKCDCPKPVEGPVCPECVRREGKETCPWCGSIDIEEPGLDFNRYCNSCRKPVNRFY